MCLYWQCRRISLWVKSSHPVSMWGQAFEGYAKSDVWVPSSGQEDIVKGQYGRMNHMLNCLSFESVILNFTCNVTCSSNVISAGCTCRFSFVSIQDIMQLYLYLTCILMSCRSSWTRIVIWDYGLSINISINIRFLSNSGESCGKSLTSQRFLLPSYNLL